MSNHEPTCNCGVGNADPGYHLFTCPRSGKDYEGRYGPQECARCTRPINGGPDYCDECRYEIEGQS